MEHDRRRGVGVPLGEGDGKLEDAVSVRACRGRCVSFTTHGWAEDWPLRTKITPHHTLRSFGASERYIPSGAEYFKLALRRVSGAGLHEGGAIQLDKQVLAPCGGRGGNGWTRHGGFGVWWW